MDVEKITVFQRRNSASLSTLNQSRSLTLKQRLFWVESKTLFRSYIMFSYKTKIFILTLKS